MFVGHYAAALALKPVAREAPVGLLFLAAQFLDILFFPLAFAGIEQLRIVPHFTESTHFELPYMPYTHSLLAALIWSGVGYGATLLWLRDRVRHPQRIALMVAAVIFSHWLLDVLVHTPDLPLAGNDSPKIGLGIWNSALATWMLEAVLLLTGLWLYRRVVHPAAAKRMSWLVILLLAINVVQVFGPPLADEVAPFAMMALASYFAFAVLAHVAENGWRKRGFPVR